MGKIKIGEGSCVMPKKVTLHDEKILDLEVSKDKSSGREIKNVVE